jgi:hypothetical protein
LSEEVGWNFDHPVFCVSARKRLEARTSTVADGWSDSGTARLESFLVDFLAREKFNTNQNLSFTCFARSTRERLDETVAALETVKVDLSALQPSLSSANEPKAYDRWQSIAGS